MEKTPTISVIVPVYNIRDCLPKCVRSLTAQTFRDLEILLVDDGSTDGTGALCEELAGEDPRIRVFHKENGGSSSARNLGIREARGRYLGFVDSDDYVEPQMYERLYEGLCRENAGRKPGTEISVAQIGRDEVDSEGRALADICTPPAEPTVYSAEEFLRELLLHKGDCSFCTKLIDKALLQGRGFPEGKLNEDFRLLVQLLQETPGVLSLPGYQYHVYYRIGSNTRKADKEQFSRVYADCVENADMAAELVRERYPELEEIALRFGVFQRLEYLLHIPISRMTAENREYREIAGWLRRNLLRGLHNPYLTGKNKLYQMLFAVSPKGIRVLHKKLKRF